MKLIAVALGLATALALAAPLPARAQLLDIATDQSPVGLDPQIATSFATQLVTSTIYEGLTAIDSGLHVVPALAESWTISPDGKTYRFKLRPGVTFHNGRVLTPADIVASVARIRDPKTGSPYASRFASIVSVQPDGSDAVRFTLSEPSAPFLAQLAALAIVPAEAIPELAPGHSASANGCPTPTSPSTAIPPIGTTPSPSSPASNSISSRKRQPGSSASRAANTPCCPASTLPAPPP